MRRLYHFVSRHMRGTTLYPLNQLKDIHPDVYQREAAKYIGREHVMETRVPTLGCLWNDVLFLSAVHPSELLRVAREAGVPVSWNMRAFCFKLSAFDTSKLLVRFHRRRERPRYEPFDPDKFSDYLNFATDSLEYYRERLAVGERPMLPAYVPHILYKSTLEITGVPIVQAG